MNPLGISWKTKTIDHNKVVFQQWPKVRFIFETCREFYYKDRKWTTRSSYKRPLPLLGGIKKKSL